MVISKERLEDIANKLFRVGAVKFGEFKLKLHETKPDAPLSPIFLNLRAQSAKNPGPLTPELMKDVALLMADKLVADQVSGFDLVAGVPHAGDPYADEIADVFRQNGRALGIIRMNKTESDGGRCVTGIREGAYAKGQHALLADDLITQADTKFEAINTLEGSGIVVKDIAVLVDRCQGGAEELKRRGYTVHAPYSLPYLLVLLREQKHIDQPMVERVLAYIGWRP